MKHSDYSMVYLFLLDNLNVNPSHAGGAWECQYSKSRTSVRIEGGKFACKDREALCPFSEVRAFDTYVYPPPPHHFSKYKDV